MKKLKNRIIRTKHKYKGNALYSYKVDSWNKSCESYDEEKWMQKLSEKIDTGLVVTQEVCDNVITPLVEKQLNGLNQDIMIEDNDNSTIL